MLKQVQYDIWGVRHDIWGVRHDDSEGFVVLDSSAVNRLRMTFFKGFEMTITVESVIKEQRMKYVLFLMMVLFSGQAVALECVKQPTCEELNYSKDDDPQCADDGYILCPFDFTYKKCLQPDCAKMGYTKSEKSSWCGKLAFCPSDKSYTLCKALCEVGDVYYVDGTCGYATDYDNTKTPVGVVFYVTDEGRHGKVINLHDLGRESEDSSFDPTNPYNGSKNLYWGYYAYDVPSLKNYKENILDPLRNRDPDLYDGKGNTAKILAAAKPKCDYEENTKGYYQYCVPQAAQAAYDFYPLESLKNDSKVGKGKWYLPALGELMDLYGYDNASIMEFYGESGGKGNNKILINNTLTILKNKGVRAEKLTESYYWSSVERDEYNSWEFNMPNGNRGTHSKTSYNNADFIRVSLEF